VTPVRDDLIRGARLTEGACMLDVGAGAGLIALEARRRVGAAGCVVALDLSHAALSVCRDRSHRAPAVDLAPLWLAQGNALRLPFLDDMFHAVTARSVLMYVENRAAAVRELRRVLRPGGWIATFDYVVRDSRAWKWWLAMDMAPFQPMHAQILRYQQDHEPLWPALERLNYDEVLRSFQEVEFTMLNTRVDERRSFGYPPVEKTPASFLDRRPFMGPSYAQAARAVLGEEAEAYLSQIAASSLTLPQTAGGTDVYVFARK
jgi:ubiquinone/menaquinone biosynthesis C-methylase UbiE